ncbi:cobalamin-binding protein [Dethiosulfatarculus sandiegensis]|uniref:Cobalamin-binding protein n=1 Tax=Dethiosulfatarculus sandiegensis TaxID=1429043 RepID=A0A0D2J5E5_9BACT|nr:cobalamin-binding protein [Dethiosulfatarculus sandiegensis]
MLDLIVQLKEEESLAELKSMLAEGVDHRDLLACFMEGMRRVGTKFETGVYFIAALIMAGEIMRSATEILRPYLKPGHPNNKGRVLIGTIEGDIHDLGKNLFALLLNCNGFEVIDLGVDVPVVNFLQKARELKPDAICISCVLTTSVEYLKDAVKVLADEFPFAKNRIVVGGTCLDARLAEYVGVSLWARDAAEGLKICQKIVHTNPAV